MPLDRIHLGSEPEQEEGPHLTPTDRWVRQNPRWKERPPLATYSGNAIAPEIPPGVALNFYAPENSGDLVYLEVSIPADTPVEIANRLHALPDKIFSDATAGMEAIRAYWGSTA